MNGRALAIWALALSGAWSLVVLAEAMLLSPAWSSDVVGSLYMLSSVGATLLSFVGIIVGILAIRRAKARALVLLGVSIAAGIGGTYADDAVRMAGMRRCGERFRPLIAAIREYEVRHSSPPPRLADAGLTEAVQSSGLAAYPHVIYDVRRPDDLVYGNRWMLRMEAFNGGGWDQLIFLPNGKYPKEGFGGVVERLGDWAYVRD